MKFIRLFCLCPILLMWITACDNPTRSSDTVYTTPPRLILPDHPLVNRIYDVRTGSFITRDDLYRRLTGANYILVGETHDNTAQHAVETAIIDYLSGLHRPASVSFEMIDDRQGRLLKDRDIKSSAELIGLLQRTGGGWDYETYYRNLFDSVIRAGFRILPANIDRTRLLDMMNEHAAPVPASQKDLLSRTPLSQKNLDAMQQDLLDSHCGVLTPAQVQPMIRGQRIRDATMALSLLRSSAGLKVLIAGNGHVRTDLGVPRYIHSSSAKLISIGVLEVESNLDRPADYAADWNSARLPFDYVWFTARAQRKDPCIDFIRTHSPNK